MLVITKDKSQNKYTKALQVYLTEQSHCCVACIFMWLDVDLLLPCSVLVVGCHVFVAVGSHCCCRRLCCF